MTDNIQKPTEFNKEWQRELRWWFSDEGIEMQYCLVAQGYDRWLFAKLMYFTASGFGAIKLINLIKRDLE